MVRITNTRNLNNMYVRRSAVYIKRLGYLDLQHVSSLFALPTTELADEQFKLPPKQPTPDVILRTDIMPQQRTHVAL